MAASQSSLTLSNAAYLVFDSFDMDLLIKVLSNTLFGPFFLFWIPIIYLASGMPISHPTVVTSIVYFCLVSLFWFGRFASQLWRNQGSWLFAPERLDWSDQVVVVTGGSNGVGALLANTLAAQNVYVAVLDVAPPAMEQDTVTYYKCDVSKWEEVEAAAKQIIEDIGQPTILVNNAGVVQGKLITELEPEDINQSLDVNLKAHFWTLKAFLPGMIEEKKGHIVTVSSVLGSIGVPRLTDYCASKAALMSLHESIRYELDAVHQTPKIRTTLVTPGFIRTQLFSRSKYLGSTWWHKFLFPPVQPHDMVKAIITALDQQESRHIALPYYAHFVAPLVSVLPSFARDVLQQLTKANTTMEGFVKVTGRRPSEGPVPEEALEDESRKTI